MRYELTAHAKMVLAERGIPIEWMERVLDHPERAEPDSADEELEHRLGRIQEYDNRVLRVIIKVVAEPAQIITAYFDRAMRNRL